jgi:tRNA pseudouridine55 synthase
VNRNNLKQVTINFTVILACPESRDSRQAGETYRKNYYSFAMTKTQGFLLINKPLNYTSFDVIACLRKILNIKKIGHTGTLDPLATGLMVIGVGQATRFLEFHTGHSKEYIAEVTFGKTSETYDAEGPLEDTGVHAKIPRLEIEKALENFRGEIEQIPPKYSALKINGQKYCNLVRQGKEVDIEIKKRKVEILYCEILDYEWPILRLKIGCSSGTYIRSIAHDLGSILACGGYLSGLNRTKVEDFDIQDSKSLEEVSEKDFMALNAGLSFPHLELNMEDIQKLQHGQKLSSLCHSREGGNLDQQRKPEESFPPSLSKGDISKSQYLQVFHNNHFYGVVEEVDSLFKPKKMTLGEME